MLRQRAPRNDRLAVFEMASSKLMIIQSLFSGHTIAIRKLVLIIISSMGDRMNYSRKQITGVTLVLLASSICAQELPLITDKPGTFEILGRTDYAFTDCEFTRSELTANLQKIKELVNTVRKNPVLSDIRGFDGRARIYSVDCKENGNYGLPSQISFEFASWFRKKDGTAARMLIEPPEWSLIINRLKPTTGSEFSASRLYGGQKYFTVPSKKETIDKGIDVYGGECFVLYNPNRPPYWLPVTVGEAFACLKDIYKADPNKNTAAYMLKVIEDEYAATPVTEMNKPAYSGGGRGLSRISSDNQYPQVVRINPEYWDRSLPKSSIQFIYFRSVQNKDYYRKLKEEYLQKNSISYNLYRFLELFDMKDIQALVPLIGK